MKKTLVLFFCIFLFNCLSAQLVAIMEVKEPIPGACDTKAIYALVSGFKDQVEPISPLTKDTIQARLTKKVDFVKQNPKFKGELMINCVINCSGDLIQCTVDNKSGNDELDSQVLAIFKTLTKWIPGKLNGKNVDSTELYSISVKKGVIKIS